MQVGNLSRYIRRVTEGSVDASVEAATEPLETELNSVKSQLTALESRVEDLETTP